MDKIKKKARVLVIATSRRTRGGITAVVTAHATGNQWNSYDCKWIETHIDKSKIHKIWYLLKSVIGFTVRLPFYQIVHIHFSEPASALRKYIFFLLSFLFRKKTIAHLHAFSPETTLNGRFSKIYKHILSKSDTIIALSPFWKSEIEKIIGKTDRVQVLFNPCPSVTKLDIVKENRILFAGTMNQRKGYGDLMQAFAQIAKTFPNWKLQFAGNGELEQAQKLATELGISDQVELLGWVSGEQKTEYFSKAKIFCLPSYAEGFPMAVLDAWSYGLPVVCTRVGGLPDIAVDNDSVLFFDASNIKQLATCLSRLISDEDLQLKLSQNGLSFAETMFNIATINKQLADIYENQSLTKKQK